MLERVIPLTWLHTGVIGAATAGVGNTGVDDATSGGSFNYSTATTYTIEIDSGGGAGPDAFKWSNDGGATWEQENVTIVAGKAILLENGLTISFAAASGHDVGDTWTVACTGQVVSDTALALNSTPLVNPDCKYMTLNIDYDKGSEDGLVIYIVKTTSTGAGLEYRNARLMDAGDGNLIPFNAAIKMNADARFTTPPIDMTGIKYFKIYQIRDGAVGADGLFTLSCLLLLFSY